MPDPVLRAFLESLSHAALVDGLLAVVEDHPEVGEELLAVAAEAAQPGDDDAADWVAYVASVFPDELVYESDVFEVAMECSEVLDEIDDEIVGGRADVVRPALVVAMTRLRESLTQTRDSGGVLWDTCQRAADLHASSCADGHPDPVGLGTWLAEFRLAPDDAPELTLAPYLAALGNTGLAAYREVLEAAPPKQHLLLELADHDGDADEAVRLLSGGDPSFGGIVQRLVAAGRLPEAADWAARAVTAQGIAPAGATHGVPLDVAVTLFRSVGRPVLVLDAARALFARYRDVASYRALLEVAGGDADRERLKALGALANQGDGHALVLVHLSESDLDAAWSAADRWGAGRAWERLVDASAHSRPADAARLVRAQVDERLVHADAPGYPALVALVGRYLHLCRAAGTPEVAAAYVASIRTTYGRRRNLMAELTKRGL